MTYYCPKCVVEMFPYMKHEDGCPFCGSGLIRHPRGEPTPGIVDRHKAAVAERERLERYTKFETYYSAREVERELTAVAELQVELDAYGQGSVAA